MTAPRTGPVDRTITLASIGVVGSSTVDRRGVVRPGGRGWLVDWAVGAQDGWHLASCEAGSRQSLEDDTPVVCTALRVPDGAIEQRCWSALDGVRPVTVVELHHAAPVAVAVAVIVRPAHGGSVRRIELDGTVVRVDGRVALSLGRAPSRAFGGAVDDVLASVREGIGDVAWPESGVHRDDGDAAAAFVLPLPHTATFRFIVSLDDWPVADGVVEPSSLAPAANVIAGWKAQTAAAPRIDLPERDVEAAVDASRRHLLARVADGVPRHPDGSSLAATDRAEMAMALDEQGLHASARPLLEALLDEQGSDGAIDRDRLDATAATLVALDLHRRLSGVDALAARSIESIASAAHWLHRRHIGSRLRGSSRFFGRGTGPEGLGDDESRRAHDARWARRGLEAAARSLRAVGQVEAAGLVDDHANALVHDMSERGIVDTGDGSGRPGSDAIDRVRLEIVEGAPCWTWPSSVDGDDPARAAAFLRLVRATLVDDSGDGIELLPVSMEEWYGRALAVHDLPTVHGRLSFALRWHGERPALLWDLRTAGPDTVRIGAPTLDGSWTSTDAQAEALLAAPPHVHDHRHGDGGHGHVHAHGSPPESPTRSAPDGGDSFM